MGNEPACALVLDYAWPDLDREKAVLKASGIACIDGSKMGEQAINEVLPTVDAIMTCWAPVPAEMIAAATKCRTVARFGVGLDNIDISTATELGIAVTNVPDYCIDEVSDHAMALVMALTRNIVGLSRDVETGGWNNSASGPLRRLSELNFGVAGLGRIGSRVLEKARAFGFRLFAFDPGAKDVGDHITLVGSIEELLEQSDVVSLHVPLVPATQHLINENTIKSMRSGAVLVNTSRGGLIDTEAVLAAVRSGHLGGVGLDVLEIEPPELEDTVRNTPRVVVTPHAAFSSISAQNELRDRTAANVAAVLAGRLPINTVNRVDPAMARGFRVR